jgi:hypothetical protein
MTILLTIFLCLFLLLVLMGCGIVDEATFDGGCRVLRGIELAKTARTGTEPTTPAPRYRPAVNSTFRKLFAVNYRRVNRWNFELL